MSPAVVASSRITPDTPVPRVPGFAFSEFNPLVNEVARLCLEQPSAGAVAGPRTALLLGTLYGDQTTSDLASSNLGEGRVHNPLLFYQSVPTTILGNVGKVHGITGPMVCLSATGDLDQRLRETAELLFDTGEADAALLVVVELAAGPRSGPLGHTAVADVATAVLVRKEPA